MVKPFHEWKAEQYAKDQRERTPHDKSWYYRAYGGYCNKMRQLEKEENDRRSKGRD